MIDGREAKVVMLIADEGLVRAAVAAGAIGFVLKDADPGTVVCAVRQAVRGTPPATAEISPPPRPD